MDSEPQVWLGDRWVGLETLLNGAWVRENNQWRPITKDELIKEIQRICTT